MSALDTIERENAAPELDPAEMREFFRIIDEQADPMRGLGLAICKGRWRPMAARSPAMLMTLPIGSPTKGTVRRRRSRCRTGHS